jgi:polysaccharide export outer membrane protein
VNGEVQKPGGFPYQPKLTVEQAIALAGGFTRFGSHSRIEVFRASDPQHKAVRVELTDPVFPGDIVTVKQRLF